MSEVQTAEQIEAEARAEQQAARAASLAGKNKGGRPPKPRPTPEATPAAAEEAPEKTILQKQAINQEAAETRRIARLKAARTADPAIDDPEVMTRVTKRGDGKISTGKHIEGLGDLTFEHKELVPMRSARAAELVELGYVSLLSDED